MSGKSIKFKFQHAPGVIIAPATGSWVAETGGGKLLCDFYYERPTPIETVTYALLEDDSYKDEVSREVSEYAIREIVARVEMSPQMAFEFGQYLVETAKRMGAGEEPQFDPRIRSGGTAL